MENIEDIIAHANGISKREANEIIEETLDYLRETAKIRKLNFWDLEMACYDLGIEIDYIDQILFRIC